MTSVGRSGAVTTSVSDARGGCPSDDQTSVTLTPRSSCAMRSRTGAADAEDALEILGRRTELVVIKLGPLGAIAMHRGVRSEAPALVCDAVDTTGAGDCFNAGLIAGLLAGDSLDDSLRQANVCAGLSTTAPGVTVAPDLAQMGRLHARAGDPRQPTPRNSG